MTSKVTRRQLATTLAVAAAAVAQTPAPPLPKNPEEELKAARDDYRSNAEQMAKVELEMFTEPAFHFKP
jgi:hypothetical protein